MSNCKLGDVAVLTWDEEPVFSNIGQLVKVSGGPVYSTRFGLTWIITPVDYAQGLLFISEESEEVVKRAESERDSIRHPDAWMRPLENPDGEVVRVHKALLGVWHN